MAFETRGKTGSLICQASVNTLWWQKLSLWLSQHGFEGVLAEGTFSLASAEQHLI